MKVVSFQGEQRTELGKKGAKNNRAEGRIPCVLYGGEEVIHFTVAPNAVRPLIFSPDFQLAEISIAGNSFKCILKDYQKHPVSDEVVHIDFLRLQDGRTVKVNVPVRFQGTAAGVKAGGKLQQMVRRVLIKTTPEYLVDEVKVDVTNLQLGQAIRVRDIQAEQHIEIMNAPSTPVGVIEIPRALRSATAAAEKAAAGK